MSSLPKPGARPVGRPQGSTALVCKERTNVSLGLDHLALAARAGAGNVSGGIRLALEAWGRVNPAMADSAGKVALNSAPGLVTKGHKTNQGVA